MTTIRAAGEKLLIEYILVGNTSMHALTKILPAYVEDPPTRR